MSDQCNHDVESVIKIRHIYFQNLYKNKNCHLKVQAIK